MDGVINNSRRGATANHASSVDHRRAQKSSTLNRKFVKKPVARPKITNSVVAGAKSLRGDVRTRTILSKRGSVKLQPIHSVAKEQKSVKSGSVHVEVSEIERVAVHHSVEQHVIQEGQKQLAQRKAAVKRIAQKRNDNDVYIKNVHAQAANERIAARRAIANGDGVKKLTAQQMKERAIQQALSRMNKIDQAESRNIKQLAQARLSDSAGKKGLFRGRKFAIAASMAVVTLALLGYLVYLNLPDISARVAAMHAGIEKSYPSYIPTGYRLDGLVKEDNGRITMNFKNSQDYRFMLQEEKSSWDSAAVLANYVKKNWDADYSIAKGQGLTIYISGSNAVWVNGGVLYIINDDNGKLSSSDLHDIAVSL